MSTNLLLPVSCYTSATQGLAARVIADWQLRPSVTTVEPILADALEEAGCTDSWMLTCLREERAYGFRGHVVEQLAALTAAQAQEISAAAEIARQHAVWLSSAFARCGVVGCRDSIASLSACITRKRPRGSGSKRELAERLRDRLQKLADRRWARATKGQRKPTPKQAAAMVAQIGRALDAVQSRCRERTMSVQGVIQVACTAARNGAAGDNGGTVTCGSYGYAWSTTTASATREPDGTVSVRLSRTGEQTVAFPAAWWRDITADWNVLAGGGHFAISRSGGGWDCYNRNGAHVGVAVPMPTELRGRFGKWEHGDDDNVCAAEIARKRGIIAAELAAAEARRQKAAAASAEEAKRQKAAELLARIGAQLLVSYEDARACGMCDAGIRAFAQRAGLDPTDLSQKIPLTEVAKVEPTRAVQIARRLLQLSA